MKERKNFTIGEIIELREALSRKFNEEELKAVAGEFQEIHRDSDSFQTLDEQDKRGIELFLATMQIAAPPSDKLEVARN